MGGVWGKRKNTLFGVLGVWVVFGWCLGGVWVVFGWCLGGVWVVFGWCLGGVWVVFGWCLGGVWVVFGWCLGGVWVVFGWCLFWGNILRVPPHFWDWIRGWGLGKAVEPIAMEPVVPPGAEKLGA